MSTSGKFTNHSVRKTCIKTLLDSGVAQNNIAQLSGHKILKSLDSYAVASRGQQRLMSKVLSGKENNKPKPQPNVRKENPPLPAQLISSNIQGSMPTSTLFSGASIGVLNIQNLVLPESTSLDQAPSISAAKKLRRHVIQSSDKEDLQKSCVQCLYNRSLCVANISLIVQ